MEQSTPRTTPARLCLLLLCLAATGTGVLQARAQPDSIGLLKASSSAHPFPAGFVSIDCGLPGTASYVDDATKLSTATTTAKAGPPVFDVYIGVNFWSIANITNADTPLILEAIVLVPDDSLQVCLVNTGSGTPFISGLDLRPLKTTPLPAGQRDAGPGTPRQDQLRASSVTRTRPARQAARQFYINLNGKPWYPKAFTPDYLSSDATYNSNPYRGLARYNVSINATANSTLPPIINAVGVFSVIRLIPTTNVATDSQDAWDGLTCSYAISTPPRITGVNLSFSGLNGDITSSFANLKAIEFMDLSHNNLTGSIPDSLSQLSSLTVLDLTGNHLNGSIPSGLLKRIQDGSLNLRKTSNRNLCSNGNSCQTTSGKSKLAIYIAIPVVLVVSIISVVVLLCFLLRRQKRASKLDATPMSHIPIGDGDAYPQSSLQLENRRFSYKELEMITNNFERVLGRGGFGKVYDGFLEDGTQVAVKLRSDSSNQGVKEFLAEAQTLTRIHHKNLVSMIGYCKDGEYMALVYEYMSGGTLQEHISFSGNGRNGGLLSWAQRLRIALESAQGLEYLHRGCNPPLIHRDVKGTNILLNAKLEAKIADFGLTKAFNRENGTQVSTNSLVGTQGYVDPECTTRQASRRTIHSLQPKRAAILRDPEPTSIIHWSRQRLARGNIEGVVDPRMRGDHDVNGVWKAADVALKCTEQASARRPTMTDVVAQLQECLDLEEARVGGGAVRGGGANGSFYTGSSSDPYSGYNGYTGDGQSTDVSQTSTGFEVQHNFGRVPTMPTGPAAR
ncbi:unnamed protein product [Urochloa decumbens]|uniref:Protein kinase domain-containing protein n=1 Tax=Urochloa decumbens TaxID=240449 RepID=A0ABC8WGK6_9POAL